MKPAQRIVAVGALSGIILMLLSVWALYTILPDVEGTTPLYFALQMNVFALLPLFFMIASIGNARFMSEAIDPTLHKESKEMEINGRVVDNTLQQNFLFFVATLALSTVVPLSSIKIFGALAVVFIVARVAFWIGYRINPLYRAPGMAGTSYMNLGIILAGLYFFFTSL